MTVSVRAAREGDAAAIWALLAPVIAAGETYTLDRGLTRAEALAYWRAPAHAVFVAEAEGAVVGTCYLRANQRGGGAHVANAGFVAAAASAGRGVARAMAAHAMDEARARGFTAMQFNAVVSCNTRAVRLWRNLGFAQIGRVPGGFAHPGEGMVDLLIMHRPL